MANLVKAPLPGTIMEVKVKEGDQVSFDQAVIILEAMKMENEISAEATGTVMKVLVSSGDTVSAGQVLMEIE